MRAMRPRHIAYLAACAVAPCLSGHRPTPAAGGRPLLYPAVPGIRNYLDYGGIGLLVYDMDDGHRLLRRIPTFALEPGVQPENVKGIAANARTGLIYVSTIRRVAAFDLTTDKMVWNRTYEGGADRIALSPDGTILYVPSLEGPHWHAVNAKTGDVLAKVVTDSGAHNTIYGPDGSRVYLAGLRSPILSIADPKTHKVVARARPV